MNDDTTEQELSLITSDEELAAYMLAVVNEEEE